MDVIIRIEYLMRENRFTKQVKGKSTEDLKQMIEANLHIDEAIQAAKWELENRNISIENVEESDFEPVEIESHQEESPIEKKQEEEKESEATMEFDLSTKVNKLNNKKRPTAITIICILGFIGAAFTIPMIFSDLAAQVGSWYPPYLGLSAVVGLVCMLGLWKMKKWAAYTYIVFVALNQRVLLAMGVWNIIALIIPGIIIWIVLAHINKMD